MEVLVYSNCNMKISKGRKSCSILKSYTEGIIIYAVLDFLVFRCIVASQRAGFCVSAAAPLLDARLLFVSVWERLAQDMTSADGLCFCSMQSALVLWIRPPSVRGGQLILARLSSAPAGELSCVCVIPPSLTVAPSVLVESVGSASWLPRGCVRAAEGSLGPGHVPLPHCQGTRFGELSGRWSRANNALSVGDCITVNNVRIA